MKKHEIVSLEMKHDGWARLSVATIRLPDGKLIQREVEDHGAAVAVLPYDPLRKTVLLVEQFRPAPFVAAGEEYMLEVIAGIIEEDDIEAAARREALEEGGLRLGPLERVADAWTIPGISTERLTLYLAAYAAADRVTEGGGLAEEDENIRVVEMPLSEFAARMDAGRGVDLKTLSLGLALRLRRPELFA